MFGQFVTRTHIAFTLMLTLVASVPAMAAGEGKVDPELRRRRDERAAATARVIITPHAGRGSRVRARLPQRGMRLEAGRALEASMVVDVPLEALAAIEADADIARVSLDAPVRAVGVAARAAALDTSLLATLGVTAAASAGRGVGVAVIDSGVQTGPGLVPAASFDFTRGGRRTGGVDEYGHGTHVAGLIAAQARSGVQGIAPAVRIISVKVLDADGVGTTGQVIEAIEFVVRERRRLGVDVINLSLGHPSTEPAAHDPLVQAVEAASRAGLVVVVAAGNAGRGADGTEYGSVFSPANAPSALTVGALKTHATVARGDDEVAAYSSRGPTLFDLLAKPDVVAPGHRLRSLVPAGSTIHAAVVAATQGDERGRPRATSRHGLEAVELSGTSMAAAVATGAVARLLAAHDDRSAAALSPNQVKAMLQFTAIPVAASDALSQGAGALNVAGALSLVDSGWSDVDRNRWTLGEVAPATAIGADTWTWGQTIVWGNTIVSGNTLTASDAAWGAEVVWGTATSWDAAVADGNVVRSLAPTWAPSVLPGLLAAMSDDTIVWGNSDDTIVWGNWENWDTIVWGNWFDTIVWGNSLDTIVWGNSDTIVWGNSDDTIVWGNSGDTIVWGNALDTIVWGN
jgi:serine protease AprX